MKKILIPISILLGLLVGTAYAGSHVNVNCSALGVANHKVQLNLSYQPYLKEQEKLPSVLTRRGCCSWHKGVCGCSGGRAVCCDGTISPTCGC